MTTSDKVKIYEDFFHKIQMYTVAMNSEKVGEAIDIINAWSYAHRHGNGSFSQETIDKNVNSIIIRMSAY